MVAEPACRGGRRDSEQNVFCRIRILNPPVMDRSAPMTAPFMQGGLLRGCAELAERRHTNTLGYWRNKKGPLKNENFVAVPFCCWYVFRKSGGLVRKTSCDMKTIKYSQKPSIPACRVWNEILFRECVTRVKTVCIWK